MKKLFTNIGVSTIFILLTYAITEQYGHTLIIAFIAGSITQNIQDAINKK